MSVLDALNVLVQWHGCVRSELLFVWVQCFRSGKLAANNPRTKETTPLFLQ